MTQGRLARWLHLAHRWLGVGLGLMALLWFVSGLVMLFVARPQLDQTERLAALPVLDPAGVRVTPAAAWQALGLPGQPQAIRLNAADGRPAYRILAGQHWHAVDAATGAVLPAPDAEAARRLVQALADGHEVARVAAVEVDQWTVYRRFDALRPFWRVELDDGRHFYVSIRSGEIALDTSTAERAWNWLGSVTHWIYVTPLRQNTPLWRNVVLWASFLALALTATGFWLGWQRLRIKRRYSGGRMTPYRDPWKRWHLLAGMASTLILLGWLLSGWLSMAPFGLASGPQRIVGNTLPAIATLGALPQPAPDSRELEWSGLGGHALRVDRQAQGSRIVIDGQSAQDSLTLADIDQALQAIPGITIARIAWQAEADSRYYALRHHPRTFPVVRVEFGDEAATVLYISPRSGHVAHTSNRHDFAQRWLYQGLHRLDFPYLAARPLLRDALIIVLSLLGIGFCLTGCRLAWSRLVR